jgi:hypothetical protein
MRERVLRRKAKTIGFAAELHHFESLDPIKFSKPTLFDFRKPCGETVSIAV